MLWRALWFPFWFGSDLSAPAMPHKGMRDERLTVLRRGLEATRFVQWMLEIQDRIWRQRLVLIALRAIALICVAEIAVVGAAIRMGVQPGVTALVIPAALLLAMAFLYAWLQRPTRVGLARFLDQGYGLDASLATSLELAQGQMDSRLAPHILNQAARTAYRIGRVRRLRLHRIGQELAVALGTAIMAVGVVFLLFLTNDAALRPFVPVPRMPEVQQAQPGAPDPNTPQASLANQQLTPEQLQQLAIQSAQAQQDLNRLADALNDSSTTKQAAQEIQNGNYNAAAQELQQVANNLDQLSPEARQQLASDLQQAASGNTSGSQNLTQAETNAAQAIQQGNASDAAQSLRNLANQVQQSGGQVRSQQEISQALQDAQQRANGNGQQPSTPDGQGQPQNASGQNSNQNGPGAGLGQPVPYQAGDPAAAPDLGTAGNPLQLQGQPQGQAQPLPGGGGTPTNINNNAGSGGNTPQTGQQGAVDQASPDSNRVPRDRRDVVQGYFTQPTGR